MLFLYSLSTRELEYRSVLGSFFYAKAIPKHKLDNQYTYYPVCKWQALQKQPTVYAFYNGLNVLNFERYKFGGVRHTTLDYVLFDLEQFLKFTKVVSTDEDKIILKRILDCVYKLEPKNKVSKLRKMTSQQKIFKSNKNEVGILLNILGICVVIKNFRSLKINLRENL